MTPPGSPRPSLRLRLDGATGGEELCLRSVRPESATPVPSVRVELSADDRRLLARFVVRGERGFTVKRRGFQGMVCRDSCVEIFLRPPGGTAYVNVECNALGDLHVSWIRDPQRLPGGGFADWRPLTEAEARDIRIRPGVDRPERREAPMDWDLELEVPWSLFDGLCGQTDPAGEWGVNLFKCADESRFPHWLSWSPCRELNFHAPWDFGRMVVVRDQAVRL